MTNIQQTTVDPHNIIGSTINNRYKIMNILGTGSFAIVYRAIDLFSNRHVAIKCLSKPTQTDTLSQQEKERLSAQLREINIMQSLQTHPFIVRLFDCIHSNQFIFLIMEYCEMDLYEAITQKGGFPEDVVKEVFLQLVEALIHSHNLGIYHRDIKPENCLISSEYTLKLTDFGLSTTDKWSYEFGCGSVRYMAPECLAVDHDTGKGYSPALNDVWSLGIIIINMLFGKNPWHEASLSDPLYSMYITKNPDILKDQFGLTPEFNSILAMVFQRDPAKRINLHRLKDHIHQVPFFTMKQKRLMTSKSAFLSHPSRTQLSHVSGITDQNIKLTHDQSQEHMPFEMDDTRHISTSENYSIDSSTNTSATITSTSSSQLSAELKHSCLMDLTLNDPTTQPLLADADLFSHQALDENTSSTSDMFYIFKYDHTQHQFSPSQHCHFSPLEPMSENLKPATDAIEKDHARQVSCVPDAHHYEEVTDGNEYAHTILSRSSSACFSDVGDEEDERYMQEHRVESSTPITPKDNMHQFTSFRPMDSSGMDSGMAISNQRKDDKDVLMMPIKNDQVYFNAMPSNTVPNSNLLSTPVSAARKSRKRGYLSMLIPSWV